MKKGRLFVIAGSSGVGKGTLIKEFLKKHPEVRLSVSTTTRNPRPGEVHGVHYFFVSKDDFLKMVENEEFLEHAEFGGNFYGTGKSFVADNLANGNDVLLEIDTAGVKQIFAKMPDCESIFILPPSREELEKRLRNRGTETEEAIQKRLSAVERETAFSENFKHKVVNDEISRAVEELCEIFGKSAE
ncbi:MAG: guanylate kinase [Candidatus Gastranaerophilaceae bacterium]